jgi:hypothetical protein
MAGEDLFRAKASRPTYRRAGLVLGQSAWVEFVLSQVGDEGMARLAADPVVTLQILDEDDAWVAMPAALRARWARVGEASADEGDGEGQLSVRLDAALSEVERLRADLQGAQAMVDSHAQEIAELIDAKRDLQDDLAAASREIADLQAQLKAAKNTPPSEHSGGAGDPAGPEAAAAPEDKDPAKAKEPAKARK